MFDFDGFVNRASMGIFGRGVILRPKNPEFVEFPIIGDFHEKHMDINLKNAGADITSAQTVLFVRLIDFPENYPAPLAGDGVQIDNKRYQIINIEHHIPGSRKLILHEQ